MSAAAVRVKVEAVTGATKDQIAVHLFNFYKELIALGLSSRVTAQKDLIPVLAANMAGPNGNPDDSMAAAKQQIEGNNTTALTLSDDRYVGIEGGAKFDELHELVHIMSAPGGVSPLHNWKLQANEGAINVFSCLTAPKAGVDVVPRYTDETRVIEKMVRLIASAGKENEAYQALYAMTFGGATADAGRKTFFGIVGAAFVNLPLGNYQPPAKSGLPPPPPIPNSQLRPNGTLKAGSEKGWKANEAADEFESKVLNWSLKWLEDRLPA